MSNTNATPDKIKVLINSLPKDGLTAILAHVVKVCVQKKVYGKISVGSVAKNLEDMIVRGGPKMNTK